MGGSKGKRLPQTRGGSLTCSKPDRDEPGMICGYPLPCPWHSAVIDLSSDPPRVIMPLTALPKTMRRVKEIGEALMSTEAER